MDKQLSTLLSNIRWLTEEIENANKKPHLSDAIMSHCKRLWPNFTEAEINKTINIFFNTEEAQK
jgi:hypothetical protein